ncbi:hypothetical protein [Rhizobium chutanense]|nr:hypothetical protein [Rhizobium chutanense]
MVRAELDDRKTNTRRIPTPANTLFDGRPWTKLAKAQEWDWDKAWVDDGPSPMGNPGPYLKLPWLAGDADPYKDTVHRIYPKIQPGDRIWVKETHAFTECRVDYETGTEENNYEWQSEYGDPRDYLNANPRGGMCSTVRYAADGEDANPSELYPCIGFEGEVLRKAEIRWRPSIHMPRWASRLTLLVTAVKIERVQDISEADAIAEGIERYKSGWMPYTTAFYEADGLTPANYHPDPRESFRSLWIMINGLDSWNANPWVIAYAFTVEKQNIDQIGDRRQC